MQRHVSAQVLHRFTANPARLLSCGVPSSVRRSVLGDPGSQLIVAGQGDTLGPVGTCVVRDFIERHFALDLKDLICAGVVGFSIQMQASINIQNNAISHTLDKICWLSADTVCGHPPINTQWRWTEGQIILVSQSRIFGCHHLESNHAHTIKPLNHTIHAIIANIHSNCYMTDNQEETAMSSHSCRYNGYFQTEIRIQSTYPRPVTRIKRFTSSVFEYAHRLIV